MGSTIGFGMSLIIVEAIRGRCASFMSLPALNGFGDIWWADNPIYFSSIDVCRGLEKPSKSRITHSEINGKNESTVGLSPRKINC